MIQKGRKYDEVGEGDSDVMKKAGQEYWHRPGPSYRLVSLESHRTSLVEFRGPPFEEVRSLVRPASDSTPTIALLCASTTGKL